MAKTMFRSGQRPVKLDRRHVLLAPGARQESFSEPRTAPKPSEPPLEAKPPTRDEKLTPREILHGAKAIATYYLARAIGWKAPLVPQEVLEERIRECEQCPFFKGIGKDGFKCSACGCRKGEIKVALTKERCPLGDPKRPKYAHLTPRWLEYRPEK